MGLFSFLTKKELICPACSQKFLFKKENEEIKVLGKDAEGNILIKHFPCRSVIAWDTLSGKMHETEYGFDELDETK